MIELSKRHDGGESILIAVAHIVSIEPVNERYSRIRTIDGNSHEIQESYADVCVILGRPTPEEVKIVREELGLSMQSAVAVLMHARAKVMVRLKHVDP